MTYVAWAVLYEGETDASYFDVIIPRLMEDLVIAGPRLATIPLVPAIRLRRASPDKVAEEACAAAEAFHLIFIHADTGGRALEQDMHRRGDAYCEAMLARCHWPTDRCIVIAPRHETEAWVLADPQAVIDALGYAGTPASIGLPTNAAAAERLANPKATLQQVVAQVRRRRRPIQSVRIYPAIAQRQRLTELRNTASFRVFEARLQVALRELWLL